MELPRPPYISSSLCKDEEAQEQINRAILIYEEKLLKILQKSKKALRFVEHIEEHLKNSVQFSEHAKVMCKICNKTIDEIVKPKGKRVKIKCFGTINSGDIRLGSSAEKKLKEARIKALVKKQSKLIKERNEITPQINEIQREINRISKEA